MKILLLLGLIICISLGTPLNLRLVFEEWQMKYDKNYLTEGEFKERSII